MTATSTATATARTLAQRLEFAPPKTRGILPSALLAVLAHLALLGALTWGVQWKQQVESPVIDAELWSSVPVLAAPKPLEQPLPEPVPQAPPLPEPLVQKRLAPPPPPPTPVAEVKDAQIALEREKKREKREEEKQALAKAEALEKLEKEKLAKKKLAQEQEAQDKKLAEKEKAKKREAEQRLADEQALKTDKADKAAKATKAEKTADDARHAERVKQLLANADKSAAGSGDANATGTAQKSSGPSASYGGRVAAKIKGNIVFPDDIPGNPMADIEFRTSPDGSIVGTPRIVKSSGIKAWDEAVVNAIIKTETLPRDVDGRIPPVFSMGFRPKDLGLK